MKLNYKRTIFVGFAFFLICAFWQAYDNIVPLMLINKFGLNQTFSGLVMALDNIFAVILLPIFGSLSDKTNTKFGRRTPYIVIGTLVAVITFILMSVADLKQLEQIEGVAFDSLWNITANNPLPLIFFIIALLFTLLSMSFFRSPAVALMPDVTVKPLRSKANAIINLMGSAGGIIVLVLGMIFKTGAEENSQMSFVGYTSAVSGIMIIGLILFILFVREKEWAKDMQDETEKLGIEEKEEKTENTGKISSEKLFSLFFILFSVAFWYVGYNAVTSKYSVYAENVLKQDYNLTLIIAQAAAIASYIPVGILASKIGRKKSILIGVVILALSFFSAIFVSSETPSVVMYIVFALAGIGWATINVNSFPMVVELASGADTGKYTGYYYTASMAAQVITPVFSGALMDAFGMQYVLFIYATVFVMLSFITMLFVKYGDSIPDNKKDVLEHLDVDN